MKKNFKYAALFAAALTMGLTGCSNDENAVNGGVVEVGKPTTMSLELIMPNMQTKAADVNASGDESKVKSVDVFIYDAATQAYESHTRIEGTFVVTDGVFSTGKDISTTTGKKHIYVGVNVPEKAINLVKGLSATDLGSKVAELSRADMTSLTNGLPMFSKDVYAHEMNTDKTNNKVTVTVKRMVSKITVDRGTALANDNLTLGTLGTLNVKDMQFAVYNFNQKQFLLQSAAPEYMDPNWASFTAGDFCVNPTMKDWAVINTEGKAAAVANAVYASENTSKGKTKGEITRVTLRAKFTPNVGVDSNGKFYAYTITKSDNTKETKLFKEKSDADAAYAAETGVTSKTEIVTYDNNYCYYHIYLNKKDLPIYKFDVARNRYFACTIKSIKSLGRHTPEIKDPEDKEVPGSETDSYELDADVEIMPWEVVDPDEYEL